MDEIDGRPDTTLGDLPRQHNNAVELLGNFLDSRIAQVIGRDEDGLHRVRQMGDSSTNGCTRPKFPILRKHGFHVRILDQGADLPLAETTERDHLNREEDDERDARNVDEEIDHHGLFGREPLELGGQRVGPASGILGDANDTEIRGLPIFFDRRVHVAASTPSSATNPTISA